MNIAELSIRKSVVTWTFTVLLVVVGIQSYQALPRLEDPEFAIKDAVVTTPYPGASAEEVAEEVTSVIEKACQELGQLKRVETFSYRDYSVVKVKIQDKYDKTALPQIWDELRRKVNDYQSKLPPGAGPSIVNDDYGDVYGAYLAIHGEGYTYAELWDYADLLQRELLLVRDVKRVVVIGKQREVVWVEMSRAKMAQFAIPPEAVYAALAAKNVAVSAGRLELGVEYVPIVPTGEFRSEQQFGDLLVGEGGGRLVYLRDIATIRRGYEDPPNTILRHGGQPAIGLGISTVQGGNVVKMGEALSKRLAELESQAPLGMEVGVITLQSDLVTESIRSFVVNLLEAVAIVVVVLLIFMGLRSGLIIGAVLFLTICGTFIFMKMWGVILERISLGALIIALGMLVDNAIVVADGMKVRMQAGKNALDAAREVVGQTAMPLLGATVVAVLAFASIGTSKDSTGEFCRSLFQVILISLMLSWVTAVTVTPLLCKSFLMGKKKSADADKPAKDPYDTKFYRAYRTFLTACLRARWVTAGVVAAVFAASLWGFGFVKQSFFPDSTRAQFFVQFYFPEGTHITETERRLEEVEEYLRGLEGVEQLSTVVGGGHLRFLLTYAPERPSSNFGEVLATVDDYRRIRGLVERCQPELETKFPDAIVNVRMFLLGPGEGGKIQLRVSGPDVHEVRKLAHLAEGIMRDDPGTQAVRNESTQPVKVVRPVLAETQASRAGVERPDVANAVKAAFSGLQTGLYREAEELLPILARSPETERVDVDNLRNVQVWSPVASRMIPIQQVVSGFETVWEEAIVMRWNRTTTMRLHCDPRSELPSEVFARIKPKIEQALGVDAAAVIGRTPDEWDAATIPVRDADILPLAGRPGYFMAWGGQAEDSARANASLAATIPIFVGMMVLIVIILFNSIRQPLVIWLCVPLALIGVTAGLLVARQPFGFMALLGLLSLSGMLIKNAIVLVDEINVNTAQGLPLHEAIVTSGVSRVMPVSMAALTTILGMLPLVQDAFFVSMAVTIMAGLGVATVLTLIVVPVFYAIVFRVRMPVG